MQTPRHERIPGLDGLRGLLAIMVAFNHANGHLLGWAKPRVILNASFAVDIFFAMSGIVLYCAYSNRTSFSWRGLIGLLGRRFFRLYPLYLASLLFISLLFLIRHGIGYPPWIGRQEFRDVVENIFLAKYIGGFGEGLWNDPAWSIAIELWCGTLICFATFRLRPAYCLLLGLSCYAFLLYKNIPLNATSSPVFFGVINPAELRCAAGMLVGVAFWRILREQIHLTPSSIRDALVFASLPAIFLPILLPTLNISPCVTVPVLLLAILGLVLLPFSESPLVRLLDSSVLRELGELSFSIYLLHVPIIFLLLPFKGAEWASMSLPAIAVFTTILVAKPFSMIERFGMSIGHHILNKHNILQDS